MPKLLVPLWVLTALIGTAAPSVHAAPPPPAIGGTWSFDAGDGAKLTLVLGADGRGSFVGEALTWKYAGTTLTLASPGEAAVGYRAVLRGNALEMSGGDLPLPVTLQREAAPAAPGAPPSRGMSKGIQGTWLYSGGGASVVLELAAGGSGKYNGSPFTWTLTGTTLKTTAPNAPPQSYVVAVRGDALDVSGGDLSAPVTLYRKGSEPAGPAAADRSGVAGVWYVTEASLDPSFYMSFTQYITLYPDGSVAWSKAEGGASRTQVTQNMERFRSWRQGGPVVGNAGQWESNGGSIVIRWRFWNNLVSRGQVNLASGRMSLSGMGVLEEGATLTFQRD